MAKYGEAKRYFQEVVLPYEGDECLVWPFERDTSGYGRLLFEGRKQTVSRIMCEKENGPPPTPTHEAAHSCGNGRHGCVTRVHMSWKTPAGNAADRLIHGTHTRGERCGAAKLTKADIQEIRAIGEETRRVEIATRFNINPATVYRIINGERWGWLERSGEKSAATNPKGDA